MDLWHPMIVWHTLTPDGHELVVRREGACWSVRSGVQTATSRSLDVALIEVIRADDDVAGHRRITDYAAWIRRQAASIEGPAPPQE